MNVARDEKGILSSKLTGWKQLLLQIWEASRGRGVGRWGRFINLPLRFKLWRPFQALRDRLGHLQCLKWLAAGQDTQSMATSHLDPYRLIQLCTHCADRHCDRNPTVLVHPSCMFILCVYSPCNNDYLGATATSQRPLLANSDHHKWLTDETDHVSYHPGPRM